jgi:hypothetical protein
LKREPLAGKQSREEGLWLASFLAMRERM